MAQYLLYHIRDFVKFLDGTRLAAHLGTGTGLLVDFNDSADALRHAIAPWSDRIHRVALHAKNELGLSAMLVRPDGFVAWASDEAPRAGEVEAAARRWFGAPA